MKLSYRINTAALSFFLMNFLCVAGFSSAQQIPIGSWKEYLPYQNAVQVVGSDNKIYCLSAGQEASNGSVTSGLSLYSVNKSDLSFERYSKVTGLSDFGINTIAFDKTLQLLFIAYTSSNIDLLEPTGIVNIPDISQQNLVGDKGIYNIYFLNNYAYLSCGFGIVVVDLVKNEIHDTYYIGPQGNSIHVNAVTSDKQNFYAATASGLFVASITSSNLAFFANWTNISGSHGLPAGEATSVLTVNNNACCVVNNALYTHNDTGWIQVYAQQGWVINSISAGNNNNVLICEMKGATNPTDFKLTNLNSSGQTDSIRTDIAYPLSAFQDSDGSFWVANFYRNLSHITNGNSQELYPNGPSSYLVSNIAVYNHNVYVASGGVVSWNYTYNPVGFYARINDSWLNYSGGNSPILDDSVKDIFLTAVNPVTNLAYFCSYGGGLVEYNNNTITNVFKQNSSLTGTLGDNSSYRVSGIAFDQSGNMWLSDFGGSVSQICLRTIDGKWYGFNSTIGYSGGNPGPMVIDQNGYKWIQLEQENGILVYDSGNNPTDPSDDRYALLSTGVGKGNLPSNNVLSMAVDQNGYVWIGTDMGVAVFYCSSSVFDNGGCDAQQVLVKQDQYYNYLLITDVVNTIAVDGANRKWFGTNNGVYLMSADGTQQIYNFNVTNSPIFSNNVNSIAIDNQTGEVFIGTDKGLQVFRSTAEYDTSSSCAPLIYPNPVKENYLGPIAIKGLVNNSQVKITDVAGQLVYQTTALGTQAIWNGNTLSGGRAASGVYLVYALSPDGTRSCITKLVLIN